MVEEGFLGDSRVGDDDREGTAAGAWCGPNLKWTVPAGMGI